MKRILFYLSLILSVTAWGQSTNIIQNIQLTAGGGTVNLPVGGYINLFRIYGNVTLTSNWTIQASGTPVNGQYYEFIYEANLDLNGNNLTVFGEALPENLEDKN